MHFRQKPKMVESGEGSPRSRPCSDPRFPSEAHLHTCQTHTFQIVLTRYLDEPFFHDYCYDIVKFVRRYQLEKLVYCSHHIILNLSLEFYNNLSKIGDGLIYQMSVRAV